MAEFPPLQVVREVNGYTVTEGEMRPNVRPRRFVAVTPEQLGEVVRKWAEKGEAVQPFDLEAGAAPPLIAADSFRFPTTPAPAPAPKVDR